MLRFYVGLHHPCDAGKFDRCMVSIAAVRNRKSNFPAREWMLDSGAFMEIKQHGRFRDPPEMYAKQILRWWECGLLIAAVSQDFMCEPFILEKTGMSVSDHQRLTIERYDALRSLVRPWVYVLPVLQGYAPAEYVSHLGQYGDRLRHGQWVGVGSVCKRNCKVDEIQAVLVAIKRERPDLRLHGFGVKATAMSSPVVVDCLWSADSMAWSYAARREGRNRNSPAEAARFAAKINRAAEHHERMPCLNP